MAKTNGGGGTPAIVEEEGFDDRTEKKCVEFLKSLVELHEPQSNRWFVLPTNPTERGSQSNNLLSRAIGLSDKEFAKALFSGTKATTIDDLIKNLKAEFDVEVAQLGVLNHHSDTTMMCINFDSEASLNDFARIFNDSSSLPAFAEAPINEAKTKIAKSTEPVNVVMSLMKRLGEASKQEKSGCYILFSQNEKAKTNPNYAEILNSKITISSMIDMEPDIFGKAILKKKGKRTKAIEFLMQEFGIKCVFDYKKVHQVMVFGGHVFDLKESPCSEVTSLAEKYKVRNEPSPAITTVHPIQTNTDSETQSGQNCNVISPTNSDCGGSSNDLISDDSTGETQPDIDTLLHLLIKQASHKGGSTLKEFEKEGKDKEYAWKDYNKSTQWSREEYIPLKKLEPILHAYCQQDPIKLFQLVSYFIDNDKNVCTTFRNKLLELADSKDKTKKGFKPVIKDLAKSIRGEEDNSDVNEAICESLKEFFVAIHSRGTRPAAEQQAMDATLTAAMFENENDEEKALAIQKRLGVTRSSIQKALTKVAEMASNNLKYEISRRAERIDCKDVVKPYIDGWIHDDGANRVSKIDTGDFTLIQIGKDDEGNKIFHNRRRWIECAKLDDVYAKWQSSKAAKQFQLDYPKHEKVGKTKFMQHICKCARFGKHDQCSDQIMSQVTEASMALERVFNIAENEELGELCDDVVNGFLSSIRKRGEDILDGTLCERKTYPELTKRMLPEDEPAKLHSFECVHGCSECGVDKKYGAIMDVIEEHADLTQMYYVFVWEKVPIDNTDNTQNALVRKDMTLPDLYKLFLKSLKVGRNHYVRYKYIEWILDMVQYNGLRDERRVFIEADFAATPDLYQHRTGTGQVLTHAVIEPFICHQCTREEDGKDTCTTDSRVYIGGCEGRGKRNDWRYHGASSDHTIKQINEERALEGKEPLIEVIIATDRCGSQFLNCHNVLAIAKHPTKIKHIFASKYRFKGQHDAEGGRIKANNKRNVMRGEAGTTPFQFYKGAEKYSSMTEEYTRKRNPNGYGMNKIRTSKMFFVTYNKDEESNLLNQGEDEGNIVYANMQAVDDTDTLPRSQEIYMIECLGPNPDESVLSVTDTRLQHVNLQFDRIRGINQDTDTNDDFYDRVSGTSDLGIKEQARLDFILVMRGLVESIDDLDFSKKRRNLDYLQEFATRIGQPLVTQRNGERTLSNNKKTLESQIRKWMLASKYHKIWYHRSKDVVLKLYFEELKVGDIINPEKSITIKVTLPPQDGTELGIELESDNIYGFPVLTKISPMHAHIPECLEKGTWWITAINSRKYGQDAPIPSDYTLAEITRLQKPDQAVVVDITFQRKLCTSLTIQQLMERILGIPLRRKMIDEEDHGANIDPSYYYVRTTELPCYCEPCENGDFANCKSPAKQWMRPQIYELKDTWHVPEPDQYDGEIG